MTGDDPRPTGILVPDGREDSRTYQVTYRRLRVFRALAIAAGVLLVFLVGSWGFLASRSARVTELESTVAELRAEQSRIPLLVQQLDELEAQYSHIRSLFAPGEAPPPGELWLPPPGGGRSGGREAAAEEAMPNSWPLTEPGFITQGRFEGEAGSHPGLDIAVPTDSYIRAAGSGVVLEVGEDATYGHYVRLDHGNGYQSLYAHATRTMVYPGETVRKNEVIALSGSTGQSTAPHLHFEILRDGVLVDPLELVSQP